MKGLFLHDHRFPCFEGEYYSSSGFDEVFTDRYLSIFEQFSIFARCDDISYEEACNRNKLVSDIEIETIHYDSQLFAREKVNQLRYMIKQSDCCVVRLPSFIGSRALFEIKKLNKPYIIEMVGCPWDSLRTHKNKKARLLAPFMRLNCLISLRRAKYVVYVTKEFLEKRYPTRGRYINCSNVFITDISSKILENKLSRLSDYKNRVIRIGTCGKLDIAYKGQHYMLEALALLKRKHPEIKIVYSLVGDGDQSILVGIAKSLGVFDSVEFVGRLSHDEVFNWLDDIDIYCSSSLTEGLARVMIEAMSRGCPVISTDVGGAPELIDDNYLCRPKNGRFLYQLLIKMIEEGDLATQSKKNFEKAKEYSKDVLDKKRQDFYLEFFQSFN